MKESIFFFSVIPSSQSCHTHTFSGSQLTFYNSPGKTFTCWRKGKAFPERNWMNELPGRSSEDPESPCWIFAQNSTSTAGQGWRSYKTWLGNHGSPLWNYWMWSPTWGTVLVFLAPECGHSLGHLFEMWVGGGRIPRTRTWETQNDLFPVASMHIVQGPLGKHIVSSSKRISEWTGGKCS